jgi:hypothetical protein
LIQVLTGGEIGGDTLIVETALDRGKEEHTSIAYEYLRVAPEKPSDILSGLGVGSKPERPPSNPEPLDRERATSNSRVSRQRAYAFRAQSEALRHHSDILLAVLDPDAEGKAGGTFESMSEALRDGIPVIAILARGDSSVQIRVLVRLDDLKLGDVKATEEWRTALDHVVQNIISFPDNERIHLETSHSYEST